MTGKKAWRGRFGPDAGRGAEDFTASLSFDRRLYQEDIAASEAHARMLAACGILSQEEAETIITGLHRIRDEIDRGEFPFDPAHEDIHMNIEARLIDLVGPVGGKLHTARSRNDQVATDMHLYIRKEAQAVMGLIQRLQTALVNLAHRHRDVIMPGYTHLQRAQPVLFAHHLLAYYHMLERDRGRIEDCLRRANECPLGSCALAGTPFPIDREMTARELGFSRPYANSLDAVSDRDFLLEFLSAAAILMVHLSRLAEELILWSTSEFGFVELSDAYCTGSSIMPQKKNPDTMELVRGKAGRVIGDLVTLLTVMKGLPLAYNSDMQEDKEATFDAVDTVKACLEVAAGALETMEVHPNKMRAAAEGFVLATDLADRLAAKGIPFREAHARVGALVRRCLQDGVPFEEEAGRAFPGVELSPAASVASRRSYGGTSPAAVREEIERARANLAARGGKAAP